MASYKISLIAVPAQTFSAQLGAHTLRFNLQWQERFGYFRVDIFTSNNTLLTAGRILNIGVDLLAELYPAPASGYGSLVMTGDTPTPTNLGIDNQLVWSDAADIR